MPHGISPILNRGPEIPQGEKSFWEMALSARLSTIWKAEKNGAGGKSSMTLPGVAVGLTGRKSPTSPGLSR